MAKIDFDHTGASGVDDQDSLAGLTNTQGDIPAWWLSTANTESWLPQTDSIGTDSFAADEPSSTDSGLHHGLIASANSWWTVDGANLPGSASLSDGLAGDSPFAGVPGFLSGLPTGPNAGIITALSTPAADPLAGTEAPTLAGGPSDSDLIFIGDAGADARGGPGGGGGGGSGGSGVVTSYLSGADTPNGYNIQIDFKGTWTVDLQNAFKAAAEWLSDVITADIANVFYKGKVIDDIVISAQLTAIDGPGGILGQSGPTAIRTANYLPATAQMQFDVADANNFYGQNLWDPIVLHEMMHCVGFGTIWDYKSLVSGEGTSSPVYIGADAKIAYQIEFSQPAGTNVPVEDGGGAGTANSHWNEESFQNELMTGYIDASGNYASGMTIASLEDLGYQTIWDPSWTYEQYKAADHTVGYAGV